MELVYLDWAATAPISPDVLEKMSEVFVNYPGNPSSVHREGKRAKELLNSDRNKCAEMLGTEPDRIFFTGGGTEANAIIMNSLIARESRGGIVISALEHPSVYEYTRILKKLKYSVTIVNPDRNGIISPDAVISKLNKQTVMVVVMAVNNETGMIQPVKEISKALRDYEKTCGRHIHLHCDAVQALGKIPLDLGKYGADSVSLSAHKIQGPRGTGILYSGKTPDVLSKGGGQEAGVRPGTENIAGIRGMTAAVEYYTETFRERSEHASGLKKLLSDNLERIPGVHINFPAENQSPFILSARTSDFPGEVFTRIMSDRGFAISPGSACSSKDRAKKTRVLTSSGLSDREALNSFRVSTGISTDEKDILGFCGAVEKEVSVLRRK